MLVPSVVVQNNPKLVYMPLKTIMNLPQIGNLINVTFVYLKWIIRILNFLIGYCIKLSIRDWKLGANYKPILVYKGGHCHWVNWGGSLVRCVVSLVFILTH